MNIILLETPIFEFKDIDLLQNTGHEILFIVPSFEKYSNPRIRANFRKVVDQNGIQSFENLDLQSSQFINMVKQTNPDLILSMDFHMQLLSKKIISLSKYGGINIHLSLLPRYRGETPTNWMLINGENKAGFTAHLLTEFMDVGDIVEQRKIKINENETDGELRKRLFELFKRSIQNFFSKVEEGEIKIKYDPALITTYPPISDADAMIRFDESAVNVHNRIRATIPFPGPYTILEDEAGNKKKIRILKSEVLKNEKATDQPGTIVDINGNELIVNTKDHLLRLQISDKTPVSKKNAKLAVIEKNPYVDFEKKRIILHLPDKFGFKPGAEIFPKMVVVSMTYVCNSKCPNCPYTETNSKLRSYFADTPFISPGLFKKIAKECGKYGAYIRLTGGGEPLLHPNIVELIKFAKSVGAKIWLNTNGSLFTEKMLDEILSVDTDVIEFSVDAADEKTYAIVRPGLSFRRLLQNFENAVRLRNQKKSKTKIVVSVINQKIVKDRINEIKKFWLDKGADEVIIRKFLTWGSATKLDPKESGDLTPYLDKYFRIPCPWLFERINVDTRGNVIVCGFDISGRTNLGNVEKKTLKEIWRGSELEQWRKKHLTGNSTDIPLCRECPDIQYRSWKYCWERVLKHAEIRRRKSVETTEEEFCY
jgi:radical SAM protein with 4Fe4S-binding SPASM domain